MGCFGGLFDIISKPLSWIINFCYDFTGNYVVALILFSLILQILLLPFAIKQQKNSIKQARLDPKVKAIRKKYAGRNDKETQQKMNNEVMELYQKENFNPMGGCLPLLIQMPILFAIYNVVTEPLTYICNFTRDTITALQAKVFEIMTALEMTGAEAFAEGKHVTEINLMRQIREIGTDKLNYVFENGEKLTDSMFPNFSLGVDFSYSPAEAINGLTSGNSALWPLLLITVFTLVFTLLSQWITKKVSYNPNPEQANGGSMKVLQWTMPALSVFIAHTMAGAVGLYWIIRNIFTTIQTVVLAKAMPLPRFTEEDYKAAEKEFKVKPQKKSGSAGGSGKKVRSLHRIDEEDDEEAEVKTDKPSENKAEEKTDAAPELKEGVNEADAPKLKDESDREKK